TEQGLWHGGKRPMERFGKSTGWLREELDAAGRSLLILDCRSRDLYDSCHVEQAVSVVIPKLLLRRLRKGNLSVQSLMPHPQSDSLGRGLESQTVVLYDESSVTFPPGGEESVLVVLLQRLKQEGNTVYYLKGKS
uniref:Rhodanese domain-containing protein n=1 Tax=Latimeria chalumnae TaxID=7897 RepID=H2ZSW9_LATCH